MRYYSLESLRKQLETAQRRRDEEIMKPGLPWGYGMRHSKLPSTAKLDRLDERIKELKARIAEREAMEKRAEDKDEN